MFLDKLLKNNYELVDYVLKAHKNNVILPDSYVIDVDTFVDNARKMLSVAKEENIDLYFMLKQVGRNPYLAQKLIEIGYRGAVVVDYKEAQIMMANNIHICNIGNLVQVPQALLEKFVKYNCDYFTCFSLDIIKKINLYAEKENKVQKIMLKVIDKGDTVYSGQTSGFSLSELPQLMSEIDKLSNVKVDGLTSFPCFMYNCESLQIESTNNLETILRAKEILNERGYEINNINGPSATCINTIKIMKNYGINSAEPGHGLTGTTPLHAMNELAEQQCVLYLSEISHNYLDNAYCYGGGFYRRSHVSNAIIGYKKTPAKIIAPNLDSIDYYFQIDSNYDVGLPVIMSFRYQMFVTRSDVCLVEGLKNSNPHIVGIYNGLGDKKGE
ncbi:MAG: alanine racemase [Erysipelotrichaceae bacterium]